MLTKVWACRHALHLLQDGKTNVDVIQTNGMVRKGEREVGGEGWRTSKVLKLGQRSGRFLGRLSGLTSGRRAIGGPLGLLHARV
jgi:hypothetical protein